MLPLNLFYTGNGLIIQQTGSNMNNDHNSRQAAAVKEFHELHKDGCFIIPNPWDIGTAKFLAHLGFKALATTSAGFAFSRGLPDEVTALSKEDVLKHANEIAAATSLPVNADFQSGYADSPEGVASNVVSCIQTGIAGLSIEDATGNKNEILYEKSIAVERLRAARAAIDSTGIPVILTARCEAYLYDIPNPEKIVMERMTAFADAGADCLFAPGVLDAAVISQIVKEVAPKPVNVIVYKPGTGLTFSKLADLGVRRISVGSALARTAWGAFIKTAKNILETGAFDSFESAASFDELNKLFNS